VLYYENDVTARKVEIDKALLEENNNLQFRMDLMDCYIDICAPGVCVLVLSAHQLKN